VWLEATAEVTRQLLANRTEPALDLVVRSVAECAEADVASLVLKADNGEWMMRARAGLFGGYPVGTSMDTGATLTGRIIRSARSEVGSDFQGEIAGDHSYVAAIGAPILGVAGQVLGVVGVARWAGHPLFTEEDVELLAHFAQEVGAALDLDRARHHQEAARLGEERDRIAADLHDHVIQELFATAMGLQNVASGLTDQSQQAQVLGYVESLDETIRRIRQIIFTVQTHRWNLNSLQGRLLTVLGQEAEALGFSAEIEFAGPLRLGISDDLAEDMVAVVREGLTNVAKHAHARHASIAVSLVEEVVTVTITDDGIGMNDPTRDSGLANLRRRAESRGGRFTVSSPETGGTRVEWSAPVSSEARG
jgi:signal transduction histidine kinase